MQVHPNNDNVANWTLHSCNCDETLNPPMKNEQSDKSILMILVYVWWCKLSLLLCNDYNGMKSRLIVKIFSFLSLLFSFILLAPTFLS
jgi:hypothetical protein